MLSPGWGSVLVLSPIGLLRSGSGGSTYYPDVGRVPPPSPLSLSGIQVGRWGNEASTKAGDEEKREKEETNPPEERPDDDPAEQVLTALAPPAIEQHPDHEPDDSDDNERTGRTR